MSERFTNNILLGLDTSQATNRRLHKFPRPFPHTISAKIVHVYLFLSARGSLTTFHKVHTLQTTDFPAFPKLFPCTPLRFSTVYTSHCQEVVYLQHPTRFKHTVDHRFPYISKAFSMHHLWDFPHIFYAVSKGFTRNIPQGLHTLLTTFPLSFQVFSMHHFRWEDFPQLS